MCLAFKNVSFHLDLHVCSDISGKIQLSQPSSSLNVIHISKFFSWREKPWSAHQLTKYQADACEKWSPIHHPSSLLETLLCLQHLFVYLSLEVHNTGDLLTEINRRCSLAAGVRRDFWRPWGETFINTPSYKFTMPPSKMWPLSNTLAACIYGYEFHALSTIEGKALVRSCVQWEASPEKWPAEHPPHHRWVPCSLSSSHSDEHLTRVIYQFNLLFANWEWPCSRPWSCWKDVVHKDLQQINLVQENVPMLYQDFQSWWDKVALMGSTPS